MLATATSVEEVMYWAECFSKSTGVGLDEALRFYANIGHYADVMTMLEDTLALQREIQALDQAGRLARLDEISACHYENLGIEDREGFDCFYQRVLSHHGFKTSFTPVFYRHLLPTSKNRPSAFLLDKKFMFITGYIDEDFPLQAL